MLEATSPLRGTTTGRNPWGWQKKKKFKKNLNNFLLFTKWSSLFQHQIVSFQNENAEDCKSQVGSREFLAGRSTAEDMIRVTQLQERYRILCDLRLPTQVAEALSGLRVSGINRYVLDYFETSSSRIHFIAFQFLI